jgi:hypothetical protein
MRVAERLVAAEGSPMGRSPTIRLGLPDTAQQPLEPAGDRSGASDTAMVNSLNGHQIANPSMRAGQFLVV